MDPTAQNVGVGGALFLSALWMLLKLKPWERKGSGGDNGQSGEKSPSYWQREFRMAVKDELEKFDKGRMEKIEEIVRKYTQTIRDDIRNLRR